MNDTDRKEPSASSGRRCRLQFSLRTLLIGVTIFCILLSWYGNTVRRRIVCGLAVSAIEAQGGKAEYRHGPPSNGEQWMEVDLRGVPMLTDSGLVELAPHLQSLHDICDLQCLDLPSSIGDRGIEAISGLTGLLHLSLAETQITDAGLVHLGRMERLANLYLDGTRISDAGLPYLCAHKSLCDITLKRTQVSFKGLCLLEDALPSTSVTPIPRRHRTPTAAKEKDAPRDDGINR